MYRGPGPNHREGASRRLCAEGEALSPGRRGWGKLPMKAMNAHFKSDLVYLARVKF